MQKPGFILAMTTHMAINYSNKLI